MKHTTSTIKAEMRKTIYAEQEHLAITINDETLDVYIDEFYPNEEYLGLVPTMLPVIDDEEQAALVWERILPAKGKFAFAPVLMCPEDLDLTCTTLMVKVVVEEDYVVWEKFGIDITDDDDFPQSLGKKQHWLSHLKPLYFDKNEYMACIDAFKQLA